MKVGQFGQLTVTDEGDIFNHVTGRVLSLFDDAKGNPLFRSPDLQTNYRVDYVVAMMFLNNGELIENIKDYYIVHKDGNPKNCNLSNLELITDPEEVSNMRFSYLKESAANRKGKKIENRAVYPLYVANKETFSIDTYSMTDFCKKFGMSSSAAARKAKNCERIYRDNFNLYVCETMLDAWECL